MKINDYYIYMVNTITKIFKVKNLKEKETNFMATEKVIKREIDRKDVENAEETQLLALSYVETGYPLPTWLNDKIEKRCAKYGFRYGEVIGSIAASPITAAEYAKSATRQGVAEKIQFEALDKNGVKIEKLPSSGPGAIRILDGKLVYGSLGVTDRSTKAIDGRRANDWVFFKYTEDFGGAQDNQGRDVLNFLDSANDYITKNSNNYRFVAVIDGQYYKRNWQLFNQYVNGRVLVETTDTYTAKCRDRIASNRQSVVARRPSDKQTSV